MNRSSIVLISLLGLAAFSIGSRMMLRFFLTPDASFINDPVRQQQSEAIHAVGGGDRFTIYILAMGCGFGMFCAGLILPLARLRARFD